MRHLAIMTCIAVLVGCGGSSDEGGSVTTPENLKVSGSASNVTLIWDAVKGAKRYNVYYSTDMEQDISIYASFPNAGLEQTTETSITLDFSATTVPVYFRVTAKSGSNESDPALGLAVLSHRPNEIDPSLIDDFPGGLQWQRCSVGEVWSNASQSCTGSATVITDSAAKSLYGSTPPATGLRPPTFTEVIAMLQCGIPPGSSNLRFTFKEMCKDYLSTLFPSQDGVYPAFFVYDDDGLGASSDLCRMHYLDGGVGCAVTGIGNVRSSLVQPAP